MDIAAWLTDILEGRGGEHIRLGPVDPVRAASLLQTVQSAAPLDPDTMPSLMAALEQAAQYACEADTPGVYDDDRD
jgi:hypothetical protein